MYSIYTADTIKQCMLEYIEQRTAIYRGDGINRNIAIALTLRTLDHEGMLELLNTEVPLADILKNDHEERRADAMELVQNDESKLKVLIQIIIGEN